MNDALIPAETVSRNDLTVEHIMPQTLTEEWRSMLEGAGIPPEVAAAKLHVLGNLTLTGQNSVLGQRAPAEKAQLLRQSNLPINRSAGIGDIWTPDLIDVRSAELLELAVRIWRRPEPDEVTPREADDSGLLPEEFTVANVLDAIPPDSWIAVDDLRQLTGVDRTTVLRQIVAAGYHVFQAEQMQGEVDGVPGLSDTDGFDPLQASRISIFDAVAALERVGADVAERS